MHVLVRFKDETEFRTVNVNDIRAKSVNKRLVQINPKNEKDFNAAKYYFVKWECTNKKCDKFIENQRHYHYYRAKILLMAENEAALDKKQSRRRPVIPITRDLTSSSPQSDSDDEDGDAEQPSENEDEINDFINQKPPLHQSPMFISPIHRSSTPPPYQPSINGVFSPTSVAEHQSINDANKEQQTQGRSSQIDRRQNKINVKRTLFEDYSNISLTKKVCNVFHRSQDETSQDQPGTSSSSINRIGEKTILNKENIPVQSTMKKSNRFISFKTKILHKQDADKIKLDTEGVRYTVKDGEIYLGLDVYCDEEIWNLYKLRKNPYVFMRDAADLIWTPLKLMNRALEVRTCKTKINSNSPRKKLEKDKLSLLQSVVEEHLAEKKLSKKDIVKIVDQIRPKLSSKIQDLRKIFLSIKKLINDDDEWILNDRTIEKFKEIMNKRMKKLREEIEQDNEKYEKEERSKKNDENEDNE